MSQHPADVFRTSCGAAAPLELIVRGPGAAAEKHVFEQPFVLVGRHERNSLRLDDEAVSRQHAYLQQIGGRVFCVDLGSRTGVRWGGEARPAGWLRPGQGVQIGPFTVELAAPAAEGPGEGAAENGNPLQDKTGDPQSLPRVTLEAGDVALARLCMNRELVLVGNSQDCRIRVRDNRVARHCCSLVRTPQGVWLVDLLPEAGVSVNGQLPRSALLKHGERVHVGPYVIRIWYPDVAPETPPPAPEEHAAGLPEPAADEASAHVTSLRAELDEARERLRDAEALRQQLADIREECERLRAEASALEDQAAGMTLLQARLELAEAGARDLDVVRGERDRLHAETQDLKARFDAHSADREQQVGRLAADLQAAAAERDRLHSEHQTTRQSAEQASARLSDLENALTAAAADAADREQQASRLAADLQAAAAERDRLHSEHQTSRESAEQAWAKVSELERSLTESAAAHEAALAEANTHRESERRALEAELTRERQARDDAVQAAARDAQVQTRGPGEWRPEAVEQQLIWERGLLQAQCEQLRQQVGALQADRERLAAQLAQAEAHLGEAAARSDDAALTAEQQRRQQALRDQVFVQFPGRRP
jgi:pSer/pThr/pTyr-binding forkhead associated (FHA) protein